MSSSLIGCPIQSALCHIEAKSFVNYITIPEKVDPPPKKNRHHSRILRHRRSFARIIICVCVCVCVKMKDVWKVHEFHLAPQVFWKTTQSRFINLKKNDLCIFEPSPLMMAYEGSKSTWEEKFGKFIYHLKPEIKTRDRKLKRILIKLYRQHVYIIELNLFERSWLVGWILSYIKPCRLFNAKSILCK